MKVNYFILSLLMISLICYSQKKENNKKTPQSIAIKKASENKRAWGDENVNNIKISDQDQSDKRKTKSEEPFGDPIVELREIFKSTSYTSENKTYNLDDFENWFNNVIDTFNNYNIFYGYSQNEELNTPQTHEYIMFLDSLLQKHERLTAQNFDILSNKSKSISTPLMKLWSTLRNGSIYQVTHRNHTNNDSICFAFASNSYSFLPQIQNGVNKKKAYEYIGDYFDDFKVYDSAIYYYLQASFQYEWIKEDTSKHLIIWKIARVYDKLDYYQDLMKPYYYYKKFPIFSKYSETVQLKIDFLGDFNEFRELRKRNKMKDTNVQKKYAEKALYYLKSIDKNTNEDYWLRALIAELFFERKEYDIAVNTIKTNILIHSFDSKFKLNYELLKYSLLFLEDCTWPISRSQAQSYHEKARLFVSKYGYEYEKLMFLATDDLQSVYFKSYSEARKELNKVWEKKYDTIFAPRHLNELYQKWNLAGYNYYNGMLPRRKSLKRNDYDNVVGTFSYYAYWVISNIQEFKNIQISALSAENYAFREKSAEDYKNISLLKDQAVVANEQLKKTNSLLLKSEHNLKLEKSKVEELLETAVIQTKALEISKNKAERDRLAAIQLKSIAEIQAEKAKTAQEYAVAQKDSAIDARVKVESLSKELKTANKRAEDEAASAKRKGKVAWIAAALAFSLFLIAGFSFIKSGQNRKKRNEAVTLKIMAEADAEKIQLEADAARAALNPHFIINTLYALSSNSKNLSKESMENGIDKLSMLTKNQYNLNKAKEVSLKDELSVAAETINFYNTIQYADNPIQFDMSGIAERFKAGISMPPLLVTNALQNACKSAFSEAQKGERKIVVAVSKKDKQYSVVISDNGCVAKDYKEIMATKLDGALEKDMKVIRAYNRNNNRFRIERNIIWSNGTIVKYNLFENENFENTLDR